MKTATTNKLAVPSVEAGDELQKAIAAAHERAAQVYSKGRKTLVDQISIEDWLAWDATDDLAIVTDCDGLEDEESVCFNAAA